MPSVCGFMRSPTLAAALAASLAAIAPGAFAADEVLTVTGGVLSGAAKIEGTSVSVAGQTVPLSDVVSIRFAESARFSKMSQGLLTAGGDIISGSVSDLSDGVVSISSDLFGELKVPKARLRAVALRPTSIAALTAFAPDFEGVVLSNDDRASGEITWMSAEEIGVKTRAGIFRIPRKRAAVVCFGGAAKAEPAGLYARLMNGDLVAARGARLDRGELSFTGALGGEMKVSREMLYEIYSAGGRVVHLSDIAPAKAEHVPQFDASFPHRVDASVGGRMLTVGGRSYPRGFGVHSKSVLEFDLGGAYSLLLAEAGVDEEVGDRGSVTFAVKVDGREVYSSGPVTGSSPPVRVKAELAGGKRLTLEVGFGPDGADAGDHADWCMPVLIRK